MTTHASALVAFPSVRSSGSLCKEAGIAGPSAVAPFRHLLLTLSAVAKEGSLGRLDMSALEVVYAQTLRLWLIDRAKEKEAEMAASSLYRRKNLDHDDIGEAEMEEREFMELFPSFDDALDPEATNDVRKPARPTVLVAPAEKGELVALHHSLFGTDGLSGDGTKFDQVQRSVLASLLSSSSSSLPDTLDNESLPSQFLLLNDRVTAFQNVPVIGGGAYNFYVDPNVPQVKKATAIVSTMRSRLDEIIQEWPDQMVLQHLRSRCDVVLSLDFHSPVAKILSALEQLLLQTEDWEIYANRENTELSCWQVLLESQSKAFAEGVNEWWFRLYDATIRGPIDSCDREDGSDRVGQYLETLIPLLDDFIQTSPLGEFSARMRLLQSFDIFIRRLSLDKTGNQKSALNHVHRVLRSSRNYYGLSSSQISSHLAEQRATLEKEIQGFIKLASWKDINVQALKASAQRIHHQLYKINHLVKLASTFKKFDNFITGRIRSFIHSKSAQIADDLGNLPVQGTTNIQQLYHGASSSLFLALLVQ
ncbi:hypothetical protein DXG01_010280, partial [Tephrocybe rancida]